DPTPTENPTTPSGTWKPGTTYPAGSTATYNGATYRCVQAHTALAGWEPPNVPALWQRV
ncbi:cellulose-binding protein, partial [Nonomuraea mesophila]